METCYYCLRPPYGRRSDSGVPVCAEHMPKFTEPELLASAAQLDKWAEHLGLPKRSPGQTDAEYRKTLADVLEARYR